MELAGRNILVVGLARSGLAAARFLTSRGAAVTITDQAAESALGDFVSQARQLDIRLEVGGHRPASFQAADLIVISPGVPHTLELLSTARKRGLEVIGEVELAARFIQKPIVAVTGTNGKTTTTELLGRMLAAAGMNVFVGGNIGTPLVGIAGRDADLDVIVAEISSFQLDTAECLRPRVGVLLNVTPDHLDRYPSMADYAASKKRLFRNQAEDDFAVCNGNDDLCRLQCSDIMARALYFYSRPPRDGQCGGGALITPRQIVLLVPGQAEGRLDLSRTVLMGQHNRENIAAAALASLIMGAGLPAVQKALDNFPVMAHRLEAVGTVGGVRFINDSKATNVDAVIRALECFAEPVVLILGGRNKGYDFKALQDSIRQRVKKLIVIGESAPEILSAVGTAAAQGSLQAGSMAEAVRQAFHAADPAGTVLLSPACASFDMFASYADRGDTFRRLVGELT